MWIGSFNGLKENLNDWKMHGSTYKTTKMIFLKKILRRWHIGWPRSHTTQFMNLAKFDNFLLKIFFTELYDKNKMLVILSINLKIDVCSRP